MAYPSVPLSYVICYRYLHHLELLKQAQEKDGNPVSSEISDFRKYLHMHKAIFYIPNTLRKLITSA